MVNLPLNRLGVKAGSSKAEEGSPSEAASSRPLLFDLLFWVVSRLLDCQDCQEVLNIVSSCDRLFPLGVLVSGVIWL